MFKWVLAIAGAVIATVLALALTLLTVILVPPWLDASHRVRAAEADGLIDARTWQEVLPRHVGEAFIAAEFPGKSRSLPEKSRSSRACGFLGALRSRPEYRWLAYRICDCREGHTLRGMFAETFTAKILESKYDPDQMIDDFVRHIYLGRNAYGVEQGARNWFGKSAAQLTVQEAAFLAILPKGPTNYDPANPRKAERALARRNHVLAGMRDLGYISERELETARAAPLGVIAPAVSVQ